MGGVKIRFSNVEGITKERCHAMQKSNVPGNILISAFVGLAFEAGLFASTGLAGMGTMPHDSGITQIAGQTQKPVITGQRQRCENSADLNWLNCLSRCDSNTATSSRPVIGVCKATCNAGHSTAMQSCSSRPA